jgi:4'-phosphopantetheinyl transferase EntD
VTAGLHRTRALAWRMTERLVWQSPPRLSRPPIPAFLEEIALLAAIQSIAPAGVRLSCRTIRDGDDAFLLPKESQSIVTRAVAGRRASGAARLAARLLLAEFGIGEAEIPRGSGGQPIWPKGITGSLAHDDTMAVAAVSRSGAIRSLGSDIEPPVPLPDDIVSLVFTCGDCVDSVDRMLVGRVLFSAKEAVYKAVYPLDGEILDYADIAVDLRGASAVTRSGRRARLSYCTTPRILTLAVVESSQR